MADYIIAAKPVSAWCATFQGGCRGEFHHISITWRVQTILGGILQPDFPSEKQLFRSCLSWVLLTYEASKSKMLHVHITLLHFHPAQLAVDMAQNWGSGLRVAQSSPVEMKKNGWILWGRSRVQRYPRATYLRGYMKPNLGHAHLFMIILLYLTRWGWLNSHSIAEMSL